MDRQADSNIPYENILFCKKGEAISRQQEALFSKDANIITPIQDITI